MDNFTLIDVYAYKNLIMYVLLDNIKFVFLLELS